MTRARDVASVLTAANVLATDIETAAAISSHNSASDPHGDRAFAIGKSTLTTTGDILYASGASAAARLGIGSSNQVLTVSSGIPAWATLPTIGRILQTVAANTTTQTTNSTNTYADTTLTATITPTSSSSKILVLVTQGGCAKSSGNPNSDLYLRLVRGSTQIGWLNMLYTGTALIQRGVGSFSVLDSPATTSAVTYKTQFLNGANDSYVAVQMDGSQSGIVLFEIGA